MDDCSENSPLSPFLIISATVIMHPECSRHGHLKRFQNLASWP